MSEDEFLSHYHNYQTFSKEAAEHEAEKVNKEADGFLVVAQEFPPLGFCLMLSTAVEALKEIGILKIS